LLRPGDFDRRAATREHECVARLPAAAALSMNLDERSSGGERSAKARAGTTPHIGERSVRQPAK
jgi:hypothetical protein